MLQRCPFSLYLCRNDWLAYCVYQLQNLDWICKLRKKNPEILPLAQEVPKPSVAEFWESMLGQLSLQVCPVLYSSSNTIYWCKTRENGVDGAMLSLLHAFFMLINIIFEYFFNMSPYNKGIVFFKVLCCLLSSEADNETFVCKNIRLFPLYLLSSEMDVCYCVKSSLLTCTKIKHCHYSPAVTAVEKYQAPLFPYRNGNLMNVLSSGFIIPGLSCLRFLG